MKRLESIKLVQFLLYEQQNILVDEITGLFGPNGSGKSSALDAVQIAMFGANKNFLMLNPQADAGSKSQKRSLRSYCLGQYGDEPDQCARNHAVTYITLVWRDTETLEPVSMGVCIEASRDSESERVVGRYVIRGVELALSEHLQTVDGVVSPLPWSSFRHRLAQRASVTGEDPFFDEAGVYIKQVLLMLRGRVGAASDQAFIRAFRFALKMRFDKPVDVIIRDDVLEERPTNIEGFKNLVASFKRLNELVQTVKRKIEQGEKVIAHYQQAAVEFRKSVTWKALESSAQLEFQNAIHEQLTIAKNEQSDRQRRLSQDSNVLTQSLRDLSAEITKLSALQAAHSDHKENAASQQGLEVARTHLRSKGEELKRGIAECLRLLRNAAHSTLLIAWKAEFQDAIRCFESVNWGDGPIDVTIINSALEVVHTLSNKVVRELGETLDSVKDEQKELGEQIARLEESKLRASLGKPPLSGNTTMLVNELRNHGLDPTPVCDLVEVVDATWQPAIEAYLASNVEALLLKSAKEERIAFEIYGGIKGRQAIYGVKIVRSENARAPVSPASDTVASLVKGSNQVAVAYLRGKLGSLKRANTAEEALSGERTLTRDGMLVGPGDFERLRLVDVNNLKIGATTDANARQVESAYRDSKRKSEELGKMALEITALISSVSRVAAPETKTLLVLGVANLNEACSACEIAQTRISGNTSEEYREISQRLTDLETARPELISQERDAAIQKAQAETLLDTKTEELKKCKLELDARLEAQERHRSEPEYDPSFASDQWEKLLEQCGDDFLAMSQKCFESAAKSVVSVTRYSGLGQSALGQFLTEYREPVEDTVIEDWRKAKEWIEEHVELLIQTELQKYEMQSHEAYLASQETFRRDVAHELNKNLEFLQSTFARLNKSLKATPAFTNGERYQFQYNLRPDLKPLHDFIKDVATYGSEGDLFGEPGAIPPQFEQLLKDKTSLGTGTLKSPLDDYRMFYEFDIRIDCEDLTTGTSKTVGLLSKRIGPGSGGEHKAPLYVIAGAALASAYRMDKDNKDGLGLILLDEAFLQMDTTNIVATMRYLQELGLQIMLASPGEHMSTLTAFMYIYYEFSKDESNHSIELKERLISEEMRQRYREDMWEFNPELLDAEIIAVGQEVLHRKRA